MVRICGSCTGRNHLLQVIFVACVILLILSAVWITRKNLAMQGMTVDWDFLHYSTGWLLSFATLPYDTSSTYAWVLFVGLLNTLTLGAVSILLALVLGILIGVARLSRHKLVNALASAYVQLIRNIPLILQAFFWYGLATHLPPPRSAIALPGQVFISNRGVYFPSLNVDTAHWLGACALVLTGIVAAIILVRRRRTSAGWWVLTVTLAAGASLVYAGRPPDTPIFSLPHLQGLRFVGGAAIVPEFAAAIVTIALVGAAYIAEIVRAGFLAVPHGLTEAGHAIGLTPRQVLFKIRLPLMLRHVLPTLTNQIVWLMKATTIGVAIGFSDFFAVVAQSINQSGQTISLIFILIAGFWIINMAIASALNRVNRAIALPGTRT